MSESPALARAQFWPVTDRPDNIDPAATFAEHIRQNKTNGLAARLTGPALSVPGMAGLSKKALKKEYRDGLY